MLLILPSCDRGHYFILFLFWFSEIIFLTFARQNALEIQTKRREKKCTFTCHYLCCIDASQCINVALFQHLSMYHIILELCVLLLLLSILASLFSSSAEEAEAKKKTQINQISVLMFCCTRRHALIIVHSRFFFVFHTIFFLHHSFQEKKIDIFIALCWKSITNCLLNGLFIVVVVIVFFRFQFYTCISIDKVCYWRVLWWRF